MPFQFLTGDGVANQTQAQGTRIQIGLGGSVGFTNVLNFRYTDTGTQHTLTLMRGASRGKVVGAVAAGGTSVVVDTALTDGAGNAPAANDVVAILLDNGTWHVSQISAWVAATLTLTLSTAVPTGRTVPDGTKIVEYGVAGDAMHASQQYLSNSNSTAINFPAVTGSAFSMCHASGSHEPIIFDSNNATNAGTLNYANTGQTSL